MRQNFFPRGAVPFAALLCLSPSVASEPPAGGAADEAGERAPAADEGKGRPPAPRPLDPSPGSENRVPLLEQLDRELQALVAEAGPCAVRVETEARPGRAGWPRRSAGTGVVWDAQGHVVTTEDVVEGAETVQVTVVGRRVEGKVLGRDAWTNLALVRIEAKELKPPRAGSGRGLKAGALVLVLGFSTADRPAAVIGLVADPAPDTDPAEADPLSICAPVQRGHSGGPVFAADGSLVGLVSGVSSGGRGAPRGEAEARGLPWMGGGREPTLVVPTESVTLVVDRLKKDGRIRRGWLGITIGPPRPGGLLVASVDGGSPADLAGIRPGDALVSVEGRALSRVQDLHRAVAARAPGTQVEVALLRAGEERKVKATLAERPTREEEPQPAAPATFELPVPPGLPRPPGFD